METQREGNASAVPWASFTTRIRSDGPLIGTIVTLPCPEVVEALSWSGLDWVFIDMEHGPLDILTAQGLIRAVSGICHSMVRVPENSPMWIRKVLDTGCDGVIVPLVCSATEARRAVDAAKYPPQGTRSVGIARAHRYGLEFAEYVAAANDRTSVIVQIEHIAAVECLDEILTVEGIDGILVGPYDLSGSMNRLGQVGHPEVQSAIKRVRDTCRERDMPVGFFVVDPGDIEPALESGIRFLVVGTDLTFMTSSARQVVTSFRRATGQSAP